MPDDQELKLTIKVDKDTGAIEVAGVELKNLTDQAGKTSAGVDSLTSAFSSLLGPLAALGTAAGAVAFFKDSISSALSLEEGLRHLQTILEINGVSYVDNKNKIDAWQKSVEDTTAFTGGQYIDALARAARATNDLGQANLAVQTAMGMSRATGIDLGTTINQVSMLMQGNAFAVRGLNRELGGMISSTDTAQQIMDKLVAAFGHAAETESSHSKTLAEVRNRFEELKIEIGNAFMPIIDAVSGKVAVAIDILKLLVRAQLDVESAFANPANIAKYYTDLINHSKEAFAEIKEDWNGYKDKVQDTTDQTSQIIVAAGKQDVASQRKSIEEQIKLIEEGASQELSIKNQTSAQKLTIISKAEQEEVALAEQLKTDTTFSEQDRQNKISEIHLKANKERLAVEQKHTVDSVDLWEKWLAQQEDIYGNLQKAGLSAFDTLEKGISDSVAKSIVEGKRFDIEMKSVMQHVEEQVIASLVNIAIQAAITEAGLLAVKAAMLF